MILQSEDIRHCAVCDKAVRKAIEAGRITLDENGKINLKKADRNGKKTPMKAKNITLPSMGENLPAANGKPSFAKIKTAHELYKAQLTQLSLQEKKGQLINKDQVKAQVYKLGRQVRDSWMNWPARVSATMAAELGVDEHALSSGVRALCEGAFK